MFFPEKIFDKLEKFFHPNIIANKDYYYNRGFYCFPNFHGCSLKNRNGTNKMIDYSRGSHCLTPTFKKYWKKNKKFKSRKVQYTRNMTTYGINRFFKTKGDSWFDRTNKKWCKKEYPYYHIWET